MGDREMREFNRNLNNKFDNHANAINKTNQRIDQMANTLNRFNNSLSSKQRVEEQVAINAAAFEKTNAYVNIIIFAGYAGFFAIWSFTNEYLPEKATILTALLAGSSLFFFVFWEVFKTTMLSISIGKSHMIEFDELAPDEYDRQVNLIALNNKKREKFIIKAWPYSSFLTVVPGLCGGALLAYNFFAKLIPALPNWPT